MNFSKKNHKLVGQNEQIVKKPHKHDANLQKNSTLYFQVGLILTLLATYALFEMEFEVKAPTYVDYTLDDDEPIMHAIAIAEPKKEVKKKIEQPKKQLLIDEPKIVKNTTVIPDDLGSFITEPPIVDTPAIDPSDLGNLVDKPDEIHTIFGVEKVPIYPGCEGLSTNKERLDCMSSKLNKLVSRKFDTDIIDELGISTKQRIYLNFKIDKSGKVTDIQARNPHVKLKKEAIKVGNKIPQMEPAKQSDKNVEVMYTLPITIQVQN